MKKILCLVLAVSLHFTLYTLHCLYAGVKVSKFSGTVSVYQNQNWIDAKPGLILAQQDKIKTGPSSRAELIMDNASRIWIQENSEMEISSVGTDENMFSLLLGKIRAKVSKLKARQKFEVKTPTAVCAVRGTEFVVSDNGVLFVLKGIVIFMGWDGKFTYNVGEGQYSLADGSGANDMTEEQKSSIDNDWGGFDDMGEGGAGDSEEDKQTKKEGLKDDIIDALRRELHEIVGNIKDDVEVAREIINELKEADFATGRTLKDIHGNLVRVEQHLLRPDSQTLQFLNLTKRDGYVYSGKFNYTGPSGSRLDVLDTKITFNKSLPEQITEWPSFISNQEEDTFYPESFYSKITNQDDKLEFIGVSKDKGELDEENKVLTKRRIVMDGYINGWKVDPNYDAGDTDISADGEATGDLWATNISPKIKVEKDGQIKYVNLFSETYAINNDGKLLNLDSFTSASENPFTLLKNVAAEQILSVREGNTVNSTDFFKKGNIDLVVTPDIVVAIAQKLASQAGKISDSIK